MSSWTLEHVLVCFVIIMYEITCYICDRCHCIIRNDEKFSCTFKLFLQEGGCYVYLSVGILFLVVYLTNIILWNILYFIWVTHEWFCNNNRLFTCIQVCTLLVTLEWFWMINNLCTSSECTTGHGWVILTNGWTNPVSTAHPELSGKFSIVLDCSRLFYKSLVAHLNSINSKSDFWIVSQQSVSHQVIKKCYQQVMCVILQLWLNYWTCLYYF